MRKKVLGLVMAALAISSIGVFAQNDAQKNCNKQQKECCKEKKEKRGERGGKKEARLNPFTGITLSADQQQQIDQLKAERKAEQKEAKAAKKNAMEQERQAYDASIAKILTPEQYKQYESNKANIRAAKQEKMKRKIEKMAR